MLPLLFALFLVFSVEGAPTATEEENYTEEGHLKLSSGLASYTENANNTWSFLFNMLSDKACKNNEEARINECTHAFANISDPRLSANFSSSPRFSALLFTGHNFSEIAPAVQTAINESCQSFAKFKECADDILKESMCQPISYRVLNGVHSVICKPEFIEAVGTDGPCYASVVEFTNLTDSCFDTNATEPLFNATDPSPQDFRNLICGQTKRVFTCAKRVIEPRCSSRLMEFLEMVADVALEAVFGDNLCQRHPEYFSI